MSGRWDVTHTLYGGGPGTWVLLERAEELSGSATVLDPSLWSATGFVDRDGYMGVDATSRSADELRYTGWANASRDSAWGEVAHVRGDTLATGTFTARKR